MRRRLRQCAERDELAAASPSSGSDAGERPARRRLRQTPARHHKRRLSDSSDDGAMAKAAAEIVVLGSDSGDEPAAAEPPHEREWECPRCTFLNAANSAACEVCDGPSPTRKLLRNMTQWLAQSDKKLKKEAAASSSSTKAAPRAKRDRDDPLLEVIDSSGESGAEDRRSRLYRQMTGMQPTHTTPRVLTELWADSHAPSSLEDLCVNKKKVQELSDWLNRNAWPATSPAATPSFHPRKRLLFLCGPPGSGKSTAVRCIAKQMGIGIKEWSDNASAGKLSYDRMLQEQFYTQQTSGVDDFMDFISRSVTYAALPVANVARRGQRAGASTGTSALSAAQSSSGQVILVESWPQTWSKQDSAWEERVQRIFKSVVDPAAQNQFPVICIFSDVRESKIDLKQLSKLFSAEVVHSPLTTVMNFNSVTAAQLKKQLTRIAASERRNLSATDIQQVVDKSSGDIRHAINTLQLVVHQSDRRRKPRSTMSLSSQQSKRSKATTAAAESKCRQPEESASANRDPFLSDFHVVGKILHGKMTTTNPDKDNAEQTRVNYDLLMETSTMPLEKVLELVHANCVEYFTEVDELGDALELLSTTENFVAESYKGNSNAEVFKRVREIAQSILVRTTALTNEHPAPTAFRPISGSRGFATRQKVALKKGDMLRFTTSDAAHGYHYLCSGDTFAFDVEPYLGVLGSRSAAGSAVPGAGQARDGQPLDGVVDDEIESSDSGW